MVVGGLVSAFFLAPPAIESHWINAAGKLVGAAQKPASAWREIGVWTGAPMLVSGGLTSFAMQWRTIVRAFSGLFRGKGGDGTDAVEVPSSWFFSGAAVASVGIVLIAHTYFEVPIAHGLLAIVMSFALALVACRATGESDITPGGAMGKIMQLTYGVLLPKSSSANLMTAGITSGASLASADLLNDLKSGYLLGAHPRRQFIAQACGMITGSVASVLCFFVLVPDATKLTGVDGRAPPFPAPAAQQWRAVAEVFKFGIDNLHPMNRTAAAWGLGVGAVLAIVESLVSKEKKKWVPSPTGLGLGMTLPFFTPLSMFLGAVLAELAARWNKEWADRYVYAISAGGIAGESIVGVIVQALNNFVF
jgi:OPT family oligopeptide transporter